MIWFQEQDFGIQPILNKENLHTMYRAALIVFCVD